jgi:hypothetical protein
MKISYENRTSQYDLYLEKLVYQKQRAKIIRKRDELRHIEQAVTNQTDIKKIKSRKIGKHVDVYV